jgi:hypothetical protein
MKSVVVSRSELTAGEHEFELSDIVMGNLDFSVSDFRSTRALQEIFGLGSSNIVRGARGKLPANLSARQAVNKKD